MDPTDSLPTEAFLLQDSFRFIKPEEFESLGIDPVHIPPGTFAAHKHPSHLASRFGGNAYGFGIFEVSDRLSPKDLKLLQASSLENPQDIRKNYRKINQLYKKLGLLIRFSSLGRPYYLIPVHLVSNALTHIQAKVNEMSKIIDFHRKKYLKEQHTIGVLMHSDDLISQELSHRFREHRFLVIDSLAGLRGMTETLDLLILTRDLYEMVLMEKFSPLSSEPFSKRRLDQYAIHLLWKIYNVLKPDGEIFIIANRHTPKTNRTTKLTFKNEQEEKNFALFSHIFRTKKKYRIKNHALQVNVFDFQEYLSGPYVEQDVVNALLGGNRLENMTLEEVNDLPHSSFQLRDRAFLSDQESVWPRLLSHFFDQIFLKPLIPHSIKDDWEQRFSCLDYAPNYMIIYLGQKKTPKATTEDLKREVMESSIAGCQPEFLAGYRNSFDYVIRTLQVLERMKTGGYRGSPRIFIDRLKQPLENKHRRFSALNDVVKLIAKIGRLENLRDYINPDKIEGPRTTVLPNLEALSLFGFSYPELKEISLIVLGHSTMGRVISGKMNERSLKPLSDLARTYDPQQALNLLRYCRLMTMAEMEASRRTDLSLSQLAELFALYESAVRVVTSRDFDWETLLDEKISAMGGIHNKIIRKLLKMMNHYEFLENWWELTQKDRMEKEALADYDERKLSRIENVIEVVNSIKDFRERFLQADPLRLPVFYRKILDTEFHGTGHILERMDGRAVFVLLWIAAHVASGEIINFNPLLENVPFSEIADQVIKVEKEAAAINTQYLNVPLLKALREQVLQQKTLSIIGTGFQLRTDPSTQALGIAFVDMDKNFDELEFLSKEFADSRFSQISVRNLQNLETLYSNLESFYRSYPKSLNQSGSALKLPARQTQWFHRAQNLREYLRVDFLNIISHPRVIYTNLNSLYRYAPSLLRLILPELMALQDLEFKGHLYLKAQAPHYIIETTKRFEALINRDTENFQNTHYLHQLAQREFGPLATGTVGVSESQIGVLEGIVEHLESKRALFEGLVASFLFQDLGRVPAYREKYREEINPADVGQAGALFLEKEGIADRYGLDEEAKAYLTMLVRYHSLLHHIVRGEYSVAALQQVVDLRDTDFLEAFFLFSFIMLSAIREDLILEDLADQLFQIRSLCHAVIRGEITLNERLNEDFMNRGKLSHAVESFQQTGLPEGVTAANYLDSGAWKKPEEAKCLEAGKKISAMERLFRLRGIRYAEFLDLANLMLNVPLKFIHKKRQFSSIGYATFEKEVYEALRIYNSLQSFREPIRHFILKKLVGDQVRIFGFEKVSGFLSYENQLKLLLVGLLATRMLPPESTPIALNFMPMSEKIEERYEAVNEYFNALSIEKIWGTLYQVKHLFKAKTGLTIKKKESLRLFSIDFSDRVNIAQKLSYMQTINDVDHLKDYFHYSLQSLRKHPHYTDDYELQLEERYEKRLTEITDMILQHTKMQMDLLKDFKELHNLVTDLLARSLDIGFSEDQKHRLNDLYELRKDGLKREKLSQIEHTLETIQDAHELRDYWDSIKWYLQSNRPFFGKEFESHIARKFDEVMAGVEGAA